MHFSIIISRVHYNGGVSFSAERIMMSGLFFRDFRGIDSDFEMLGFGGLDLRRICVV